MAACMMAKLRVAWTVGDCAPGVRTITSSALFHCRTGLTGSADCSEAAACDGVTPTERPMMRIVSVSKVFDMQHLLVGCPKGDGDDDKQAVLASLNRSWLLGLR